MIYIILFTLIKLTVNQSTTYQSKIKHKARRSKNGRVVKKDLL